MAKQIVTLCVRLFSIWLLFIGAQTFLMIKYVREQEPGTSDFAYLLLLLPITIAIFLWRYPFVVASCLLSGTEASSPTNMSARSAAAVASLALGLWAVLSSISTLLKHFLIVIAMIDRMRVADLLTPMSAHADFYGALLVTAAGIFLIVKPWFMADRIGK